MFRFIWYWMKIGVLIVVGGIVVWLVYEVVTFPNIAKLKTENPTTTSLIEQRLKEAQADGKTPKKQMTWVSLDRISPNLQRAVLAGEDTHFAAHHGFDWDAIQKVWEEAQKEAEKDAKDEGDTNPDDWIPALDKETFYDYLWGTFGIPAPANFKRGGSTITQQLAKNLYLSEERSMLRKVREAAYTYFLERDLDKKRILEIYLNVIEWGDGIYGAEAASQHYFKKSAAELNPSEAAYLSAMIPSPLRVFNPSLNPKRVIRRQKVIARGMPYVTLPK